MAMNAYFPRTELRLLPWDKLSSPIPGVELRAGDGFVLQDGNDNAAVLSLAFGGVVGSNLLARSHSAGSEHIGKRDLALLLEEIGDVLGALRAELLVKSGAANLGCIALHLNDVAGDSLSLLSQLQKLRLVLRFDVDFAIAEEDGDLAHDVVVTEFTEALIRGGNGRFVGSGLGFYGLKLFLLLLKLRLVGLNLLRILLDLLLGGSKTGLDVLCGLEVRAMEGDAISDELMLIVEGAFCFDREAGNQSGHIDLLLPEESFGFNDLGTGLQDDGDRFASLGKDGHGGAAATVDYALYLIVLCGDDAAEHQKDSKKQA
jgi:hypothetical protein